MILPSWVFLALHVGHAHPLSKVLPCPRIALVVNFVYNTCLYLAEHQQTVFPGFTRLWYDSGLGSLGFLQIVAFFYFSVQKSSTGEGDPKSSRSNRQLVYWWICATSLVVATCGVLDWGVPKHTFDEQLDAITTDSFFNVAHLLVHCFLFVMVWHVSSLAECNDNDPQQSCRVPSKKTELGVWERVGERMLIPSFAACLAAALVPIATDKLRNMEVFSVPLLPSSFCYLSLDGNDQCSILGASFTCHKTWDQDSIEHFGSALEQGHLITFFVTFAIGAVTLLKALARPVDFHRKSLQVTCALYAIETSFFTLIRLYWGLCKPLLVAAAIHNVFEWSIVLHVSIADYNELCRRFCWVASFTSTLIALCLWIPDLYMALVLEMTFGIMLDWGIPLMFISQLWDPEKRRIYWLAAAAHSIHLFGTIVPLVFDIHFRGSVVSFADIFSEILINTTVPITHALYCLWSWLKMNFEDGEDDSSIESTDDSSASSAQSSLISNSDLRVASKRQSILVLLKGQHIIKNAKPFLIIGYVLGVLGIIPVTYFPGIFMDKCEEPHGFLDPILSQWKSLMAYWE